MQTDTASSTTTVVHAGSRRSLDPESGRHNCFCHLAHCSSDESSDNVQHANGKIYRPAVNGAFASVVQRSPRRMASVLQPIQVDNWGLRFHSCRESRSFTTKFERQGKGPRSLAPLPPNKRTDHHAHAGDAIWSPGHYHPQLDRQGTSSSARRRQQSHWLRRGRPKSGHHYSSSGRSGTPLQSATPSRSRRSSSVVSTPAMGRKSRPNRPQPCDGRWSVHMAISKGWSPELRGHRLNAIQRADKDGLPSTDWRSSSHGTPPPRARGSSQPRSSTTPTKKCTYCARPHWSDECRTYASLADRRKRLQTLGKCTICLRHNHSSTECRPTRRCYYCQGDTISEFFNYDVSTASSLPSSGVGTVTKENPRKAEIKLSKRRI